MITQITNLTKKSFKKYSTESNFFKRKNIIFGYNGRGKSSLSEGLVEEYRKNGGKEESIRFFNSNYVKNLLFDKGIKGVKVSFSENDADIAEEINKLKEEIRDYEELNINCKQMRESLRKKIDDLHNSNKGKANINRKQSKLSIEDVLKQYSTDLEDALKINPSREYIKSFIADSEELKKDKGKIENLRLPCMEIEVISQEDKFFLRESLGKKYPQTEYIPTPKVIKWLEDGIQLHSDSDSCCKFCNNLLNLQDIKNKILEYSQDSRQQDIKRLEKIKNNICTNIEVIKKSKEFKNNLVHIGIAIDEMDKILNLEYMDQVEDIIEKIDGKISDMNKEILINNCISNLEEEVKEVNEKIKKYRREKLDELDKSINNIEKIAKGTIALAIEEGNVAQELDQIKGNESEILEIRANNERIEKEIKELEEKQSEYKDFMDFLNEVLEDLGIQIKLVLEKDIYYLRHTLEGVELFVDSISEGEKNLLALLYFYFELYDDREQKKLLENIELIVIDDPVSSLDETNRFYVLEIMKKILSEDKVQIFILTHSWNDFCQVTYGIKINNKNYGLFEIYKNSNNNFHSEIRICEQNITPYKKLFLEVYQLQNKSSEQLNQCDIYHAANSMRRIFEEFLNFKKLNLLPQKSHQVEIEEIYRNATGTELGSNRKRKLGSLLIFINVLSHRPIKSDEIIENSKTLMGLIKDIDTVHFNEMKRNINNAK